MAGTISRALTCCGVALLSLLAGCNNNPLPAELAATNTAVSAVIESSPRHLDPVASYWSNDTPFTYQIYEPPYGYHYLLRPFKLIPKTATEVATPTYLDKDGKPLPADAPGDLVAESVYDIHLKPGILYQPHPAFAKDEQGRYRYHAMKPGELGERRTPLDFEHSGTRELVAEDYVYALKRRHALHHHYDEMANFGVTSGFWDHVFRTAVGDPAGSVEHGRGPVT